MSVKVILLTSHFLYLRFIHFFIRLIIIYSCSILVIYSCSYSCSLYSIFLSFDHAIRRSLTYKVQHANHWKRSYIQWGIESWDQFYFKEFPNSIKQISHTMLGTELEILIRNLEPKSRKSQRLLDLKCQLKVSIAHF